MAVITNTFGQGANISFPKKLELPWWVNSPSQQHAIHVHGVKPHFACKVTDGVRVDHNLLVLSGPVTKKESLVGGGACTKSLEPSTLKDQTRKAQDRLPDWKEDKYANQG